MRKRTWTDEQLVEAVKNNESFAGAIRQLGLKPSGGNYTLIRLRIKQLGLNTDHHTGKGWCRGEKHKLYVEKFVAFPLERILVKESTYLSTCGLKKKLLDEKVLPNKCSECGLEPWWNGKKLVLHLDHKDGDRYNNTLENLRLLCPNCHSQTDTYAGKNKRRCELRDVVVASFRPRIYSRKARPNCKACGLPVKRARSKYCSYECWHLASRKVDRPSQEELQELIASKPMTRIGEMYGVSDNTVRKWAKQYKTKHGGVAQRQEAFDLESK